MLAALWRGSRMAAVRTRTTAVAPRRSLTSLTAALKLRPAMSSSSSALKASAVSPVSVKASASATPSREYKVNCGDIRTGHIIEIDGKLFQVMGLQISQAAMRKSSLSFDLKDLKTGTKVPHRVKPSDKIERIDLEHRKYTFLYKQADILYLMTPDTFEQIEVEAASLSADPKDIAYLRENSLVTVECNGEKMLRVVYPTHVIAQVASTMGLASEQRQAELKNGRVINISGNVVAGDWIKLVFETEQFVEKVDPPKDDA